MSGSRAFSNLKWSQIGCIAITTIVLLFTCSYIVWHLSVQHFLSSIVVSPEKVRMNEGVWLARYYNRDAPETIRAMADKIKIEQNISIDTDNWKYMKNQSSIIMYYDLPFENKIIVISNDLMINEIPKEAILALSGNSEHEKVQ